MKFWQHLVFAFAAALAAAYLLGAAGIMKVFVNLNFLAQIAAVTALGAALPDVDLPKTKQFRLVAAFVAVGAFVLGREFVASRFPSVSPLESVVGGIAIAFAALGAIYVAKPRHRGVTHSFAALAVFALAIFALTRSLPLCGFAGLAFLTHLAGDLEFKFL